MNALIDLFTGKPFEFHTPYTLREVYQQLDAMSSHHCHPLNFWCRRQRLNNLQLTPINEQSFKFQGSRDAGVHLWIHAGGVVREGFRDVNVTGTIRMSRLNQFLCGVSLVMAISLVLGKLLVPAIFVDIVPVPPITAVNLLVWDLFPCVLCASVVI